MTGIVLAGGKSRRMGKDKAQLSWHNGTLLTVAVDVLAPICNQIVVVGPIRELPRSVQWTQDRYIGKGPLAGLHAGLSETTNEGAIVLACDMPTVSSVLLEQLIRLSEGADIVIPVHSGRYEPLCAWYSKESCLPVIERLLEEGKTSLLDILPYVRVVKLQVEEILARDLVKRTFLNLNFPEEYEAAKQKDD